MKDRELEFQHGDVLGYKLDKLPDGIRKQDPQRGRHVLAEGEHTGHAHVITDLENSDLYIDEEGNLFLETKAPVELTHEEHATQTIEPGIYEIGRVREVDPFTEEIRQVAD